MPETRSRAATCSPLGPGEVLAGLVELALALQELAVALLEHVGALVELLVALERGGAPRPASSLRRARASSSASRCMRSFSSFASRISSFWRARASASIRRASACAAFIVWDAQRLRDEDAEYGSAGGGHEGHHHDDRCSIFVFLPSGPSCAAGRSRVRWHGRDEDGEATPLGRAASLRAALRSPSWAAIEPGWARKRRRQRRSVRLLRSLRPGVRGSTELRDPSGHAGQRAAPRTSSAPLSVAVGLSGHAPSSVHRAATSSAGRSASSTWRRASRSAASAARCGARPWRRLAPAPRCIWAIARLLLAVHGSSRRADRTSASPLPSVDQLPRSAHRGSPATRHRLGARRRPRREPAADGRGGIRLAGRFTGADGERVTFAADLGADLAIRRRLRR